MLVDLPTLQEWKVCHQAYHQWTTPTCSTFHLAAFIWYQTERSQEDSFDGMLRVDEKRNCESRQDRTHDME